MSWFIFKRLTSLIPILFGVSLITFILLHLIPGDPAVAYLRASHIPPTNETVAALRVELGLNKPLYVQYFGWLGKVLQLDLGMSYVSNNSVWEEIVIHFFPTVQLTFASLILIVVISLPIGMISAIYKGKFVDQFSRIAAFVSVSMPTFWFGFLLIYFLSVKLDLFPVLGRGTLAHLVLPSLTLAFAYIGTYMRLLRASMLGNLNEPFVVYARVRGLRQRLIVIRHVLKMSLLPVITGLGMSFGNMLSGAVIVETIFSWPGMGQLFVTSILNQDYPMIQGCVLFMGVIFVLCNLLVDLTYSFLDPRIRAGKERNKNGAKHEKNADDTYAHDDQYHDYFLPDSIGSFAPFLAPNDPNLIDIVQKLQGPSSQFPLGTDHLGRCILSRLIYGTRTSLGTAFLVMGLMMIISIPLGIYAGFIGGKVDYLFMRMCDILMAFPSFLLSLALIGILGPSLGNLILAMVLVQWVFYARVIRGMVLSVKEQNFVLAAKICGTPMRVIVIKHILPAIISQVVVLIFMDIGGVILAISGLSFLGLGIQPPEAEWGMMINDSKPFFRETPSLMLYPGLMIFIVVFAFNLFGEALRDALDLKKE